MSKIHELKILPEYFKAILSGEKTFELRENDRNFKVGDYLTLREWDRYKEYTGHYCEVEISYITDGDWEHGLDLDYCILGIKKIKEK